MNAVREVQRRVSECTDKCVLGCFLEIKGVFDNTWWSLILLELRRVDYPLDVCRLCASFLSDRRVGVEYEGVRVKREVSRGCPRGSVLGPLFWNVLFDRLLWLDLGVGVSCVVYADGLVLL